MEYKTISIDQLEQFNRRDLRPDVIEKLTERIAKGFNPARPLTVIHKNAHYLTADGNHRLAVCRNLGITEIPCVIRDGNEYTLAIQCNSDEETYAPEDLWDRLDTIRQLKDHGMTLAEIGDTIGLTESNVKKHSALSHNIVTDILTLCKTNQTGRVTDRVTTVTFDFSLDWFSTSGLYDLTAEFQERLINEFIADKFNWNKTKVQQTSAKYKLWQEMIEHTISYLQDQDKIPEVIAMIKNGTFKTMDAIKKKIDELNEKAKNKLICGDCLIELEMLQDASIDLVITDPPYGIEYKSNFSKYSQNIAKEGVKNDDNAADDIFDKCCELLNRKTKTDAHLYFFIDFKNYPKFRSIAEKYFNVKTPLVWYKSDAGIGDLEQDWINGTELVIYCVKGNRSINKRRVNVLKYQRLNTSAMIHPTQKPEDLITEILTVSANKYDIFCDPFMGSGSHIRAAKKYGCNYIGIELDENMFNRAKAHIES